jgi:hypothetical protein
MYVPVWKATMMILHFLLVYVIIDIDLGCHLDCQTCYGPGKNDCLSCDSNRNREFSKNACVCQASTYVDGDECRSIPSF